VAREQFAALQQGSDAFLARHGYVREGGRYRCESPSDERIAVFCHAGFGIAWQKTAMRSRGRGSGSRRRP